jgi:hypothetical protein
LNGSIIYEKLNALYSIDPFKHENGQVNNNTLWFATPATTATRTKPEIGRQAFGACRSELETQATERLYKDAPPGIPQFFLVLYFKPFRGLQ